MADEVKESSSHEALHDWAMALIHDGEGRRNALEGQWWENIATYVGDFWVEWNPHKRRLDEPLKKPKHRVRIPINLAQPIVRTEVAKLTKNRPITDVIPTGNDLKEINSAKVGDKMLNHYAERQFSLPKVRRQMLNWTTICGSGGIFVDYDESADDPLEVYEVNGEPIFDQRVIRAYQQRGKKKKDANKLKKRKIPKGQLSIKACSPMQLIWDFSAIEPHDAWWMIYIDVMDTDLIQKRWGKKPDAEQDAEPGVLERRMLQRMDLTQKLAPPSPKAQNLAKVYRLFVKPGHPNFPEGLHLVLTRNEVLKAENFTFQHGELPVSVMGHIMMPTSQYDMSVLQQVKGAVLELSKTESQMIENRNMSSNPPWIIPIQTRVDKNAIQSKPGLRIEYNHVPNVPPPSPAQMPDLPLYVKELPQLLRQHIQDISGQGETSQGRVPPGARSGVAIAYLQEEDDTRLGPTVTAFEETMQRVNWQILQVMAEKYDIPRTVTLYGGRGREPEVFDFYGEMLDGVAGVEVQAGSALPRSKAAKQQFILDLWDRRLEQDPRKVRQMLELAEGEPDEWEKDMSQAERENRRLEAGQEVEVEEWHNHNAHLYKHHQHMKSAEYEEYSDEQKELFLLHCKQHEDFLATQKAETQLLEGMNDQGGAAPQGTAEAAANGQQVPEGAPEAFSGDSPRSLLDDEPA